jgi:hypothetical protein
MKFERSMSLVVSYLSYDGIAVNWCRPEGVLEIVVDVVLLTMTITAEFSQL